MVWATRFIEELWTLLVESGFWLLIGFAMAGAVHALVPGGWLAKQLGKPPEGSGVRGRVWPIVKASLLGVPLPLCSCSVIPVAAGLRREGASKGASAAFAISTPQTGEESIPVTWALFGPVFALARPVIAVATALAAGLTIEAVGEKKGTGHRAPGTRGEERGGSCCETPLPQSPDRAQAYASGSPDVALPAQGSSCCATGQRPAQAESSSCCATAGDDDKEDSLGARLVTGLKHGFMTMPIDLAPWLVVGLVLAAVVSALVPQDWIAQNLGSGLVPMLLMMVVGVPLYICATSSTPVAYSLVAAGLSPGAALVLLLAGPATNVATMAWVVKDLGVRALVVYLTVISIVAVGAGWAFDAFFAGMVTLVEGAMHHEHAVGAWAMTLRVSAVLLVVLLLGALVMRMTRRAGTKRSSSKAPTTHGPACH